MDNINGLSRRFEYCEVCDEKPFEKVTWYTRDELFAHVLSVHPEWKFCKGCKELIYKFEYEEGKGWCDQCVYLCYDCMDTEKYPEPEGI
jgi:hypothetical protein